MADFLATSGAWLNTFRSTHLATLRTYRRGAESIQIPMTLGTTAEEVITDEGYSVEVKVRDYILTVADLVLGNGVPLSGDQIVEADGALFEVMARPGEGAWRWSDPFRLAYRIHTKLVSPT